MATRLFKDSPWKLRLGFNDHLVTTANIRGVLDPVARDRGRSVHTEAHCVAFLTHYLRPGNMVVIISRYD